MELIKDLLAFIWSLFSENIPLGGAFAVSLGAILFFAIGTDIIEYLAERFAKKGSDE